MPRAAVLLLAAVALAVALSAATTAPAPAAPPFEVRCGDVLNGDFADIPQNVRALGVSCKRARKIARQHYRTSGRNEHCDLAKPSCTIGVWTCRRTFFGDSGTRVRCTSGNRRIRWFYGV